MVRINSAPPQTGADQDDGDGVISTQTLPAADPVR
jgi:hypothetical protein